MELLTPMPARSSPTTFVTLGPTSCGSSRHTTPRLLQPSVGRAHGNVPTCCEMGKTLPVPQSTAASAGGLPAPGHSKSARSATRAHATSQPTGLAMGAHVRTLVPVEGWRRSGQRRRRPAHETQGETTRLTRKSFDEGRIPGRSEVWRRRGNVCGALPVQVAPCAPSPMICFCHAQGVRTRRARPAQHRNERRPEEAAPKETAARAALVPCRPARCEAIAAPPHRVPSCRGGRVQPAGQENY